ncbi:MAG TPA: cytochrome c maturation protein CcmE [Desulfobacterales bacterium]|nr:cytochrome c maturation protein CcmE [Desulfobacterales bacterium]
MIKKSYIIGAVIVALAMVMAMYSFKSTLTTYVSVSDARVSPRPVQVAGIVAQGTKQYDLENNRLMFTLREDSGDEIPVEYDGHKPANFDDVTKIVATGKFNTERKVFVARELLVKCPTKYEQRVRGK